MILNKLRFVPVAILGLLMAGAILIRTGNGAGPEPLPHAKKAGDTKQHEEARKDGKDLPKVQLIRPKPGGVERIASDQTIAEPIQKSDIYPAVTGVLKSVSVNIGDKVKAGQVLAEVDAPDLVLAQKQARIAVEQAKSLQREAEAGIAAARAAVEISKGKIKLAQVDFAAAKGKLSFRQKQFDRVKKSYEQKSVDRGQVDEQADQLRTAEGRIETATIAVDNARVELEASKAKVLQAEAAMVTAKSNVDAARVGLAKAELALDRARMLAPFDGIVTQRNANPGETVRAVGTANRPLMTVMRTDIIRVVINLPQRFALLTRPGASAEITFDALPTHRIAAKVAHIGFALDEANRTMRVEFEVPNPQVLVRPGMTGMTVMHLGSGPADAVRIPHRAIFNNPLNTRDGKDKWAVYVYRDGKARLTFIHYSGFEDNADREVLGLKPSDLIIANVRSVRGIRDGAPVLVEPVPSRK